MNNKTIIRIAVIVYAIAMAMFGINHLLQPVYIGKIVPEWMPGDGVIWSYFTGVCLILAAIAFVINKFAKLAGILLTIFLLLIAITVHLPPVFEADHGMLRVPALGLLQKDLAIAAGAMLVALRGH